MSKSLSVSHVVLLLTGIVAGFGLAQWNAAPHLRAAAVDSEDRMAVCTVQTGPSGVPGLPEAVFVLDFATGRLVGGQMNQQTGKFETAYTRNIAEDFQVDPASKPKYVMVPGELNPVSRGGGTLASGALYVAEITSGKCAGYVFRSGVNSGRGPKIFQLEPADVFSFREKVDR